MGELERIVAAVRAALAERRAALPERELEQLVAEAPARPSLRAAIESGPAPRVIAEIKRRSPAAGPLRPDLDPAALARAYAEAGAAAISVLTEASHFGGSLADLAAVAAAVELPVLQKDFVLERYQLLEARAAGASAVLLIAAVLADDAALAARIAEARALGLETLLEIHSEREAERVLGLAERPDLIGVNNRDLATLRVSLEVARRLAPYLPPDVPRIAESGIERPADIAALEPFGYHGFLVGTSLLAAPDPAAALRWLRSDVMEAQDRRWR
ncbi:MAG: indole-3-glycerol phosphate synthase [Planctomycetota bacterium]|nr:MAG: indole-3-glycerol phosphate synthase [Planctomycetota bacterium]